MSRIELAIAKLEAAEGRRPVHFEDMTQLWHKIVHSMLFGTIEGGGIDYVAGIDVIRYSSRLLADSMDYEFDLGRDLWLNRSRWTMLCRQYLDQRELSRFVEHAAKIGNKEGRRGVITNMFCKDVQREAKKHRWGNCMMAFTYRGHRTHQPTLTLHSRVSYIAYIGGADLAVAHVLARYISKRIKVPVSEFRFEWAIDALQLHAFKSLPMLYKQEYISHFHDKALRDHYPAFKIIGRWWDQIVSSTEEGRPLEEIKYGPLRRVTRRYREYIAGDFLPSIPVSTLNFRPLKSTRR